jgi:hypothetical protein
MIFPLLGNICANGEKRPRTSAGRNWNETKLQKSATLNDFPFLRTFGILTGRAATLIGGERPNRFLESIGITIK